MARLTVNRTGDEIVGVEIGTPTIAYANEVTQHTLPRHTPTSNHIQPQARRVSVVLRITGIKLRLFRLPNDSQNPLEEAKRFLERFSTEEFTYTSNTLGILPRLALLSAEYAKTYADHIDVPLELIEVRDAVVEFTQIPPERKKKPSQDKTKDKGDKALETQKYTAMTGAYRGTKLLNELSRNYIGVPLIGMSGVIDGAADNDAFFLYPQLDRDLVDNTPRVYDEWTIPNQTMRDTNARGPTALQPKVFAPASKKAKPGNLMGGFTPDLL